MVSSISLKRMDSFTRKTTCSALIKIHKKDFKTMVIAYHAEVLEVTRDNDFSIHSQPLWG